MSFDMGAFLFQNPNIPTQKNVFIGMTSSLPIDRNRFRMLNYQKFNILETERGTHCVSRTRFRRHQ